MAFVKSTTGNTTSGTTATAFVGSTTSGNLIVVTTSDDSGATSNGISVSDSKGNTYTKALHTANASTLSMWYAPNITGGASHTVTATWSTAATGRVTVVAQEFDGGFNTLDKSTSGAGSSTTPSSGATATTAAANETVVGGASYAGAATTITAGSGYTNLGTVSVANAGIGQESKVVSSTGAQTATFSLAASRAWVAGVLTFTGAAGAVDLAGTATGAASATGSASVDRALAGASATASWANGSASVTRPLAGTASAASSASGTLALASETVDLAGTAAATSGATGGLTVTRAFAGTVSAAGLAASDLAVIGLIRALELAPRLPGLVASGTVRRASPRWRVLVADTRTGQLLGELPYQDLTWSDTLDFTRASTLSVTVPLETAEDVARARSVARGAWRYTLIATYGGTAIAAGPLVTHKVDEGVTSVELGCGGPATLLAARLVTRVNVLADASFEAGVSGWTLVGPVGSTITQAVASVPPVEPAPPDGTHWLRITAGGATGNIGVISPVLPVTPGLTYTLSLYLKNSLVGQALDGFVLWYDTAGSPVGSWVAYQYAAWGDVYGAWVRESVTVTIPPSIVALAIQVQVPATSAGHTLDVDAVLVEMAPMAGPYQVATGEITVGPESLPEIARLLLLAATQKMGAAAGAELPLTLPVVDTDGTQVRTYEMHELGTIAERLGQLTQVEGGPDVHLRPVIAADGQSMTWDVRIGQPRLGSDSGLVWTYGANCTGIGVDSDAAAMTMRAYVPGQTDTTTGTPVGSAEDLALLDLGWPLLERGDSARSTTETTVNLGAQAADYLRAHDRPVEAWAVTARADTAPRLGTWQLGDAAILRVRDHRWVEDGDYPRRILSVSGKATDEITLGVTSAEGQL